MGAQSLDHPSSVVVRMVGYILGLDFHVIPGYPGTPQILLEIERGALDGRAFSTGSLFATKRDWLKSGYIKTLVTSKKIRDTRLPDVPSIDEIARLAARVCLPRCMRRRIFPAQCDESRSAGGPGENHARCLCGDDQGRAIY
jgi:hypothetical protein